MENGIGMVTQAKLQLEEAEERHTSVTLTGAELKPILEALIYVAEEPISESTLVRLLGKEHQDAVREGLRLLLERYQSTECGLEIKEVAGGYKIATKAEHHDWVRKYVKHHTPPTKLSLASLETLAVIAYRQPITVPEIQEVRGVNAVSVLKTLLDKKLITTSGRKNVVGRPILYRTTKEFLVHFGLKNLDELPSLEEFEELASSASDSLAEAVLLEGDTPGTALKEAPAADALSIAPSSSVETAELEPVRVAEPTSENGNDTSTLELSSDSDDQAKESS
jgi:segregation and condensation protein B